MREQRIKNLRDWNMKYMTKEQLALAYAELAIIMLEEDE